MIYKITKKQLKETINKKLNNFKKGVLSEGVDFDYVNLTVSFNPSPITSQGRCEVFSLA